MQDVSIAVLIVYALTAKGSQIPTSFILAITPLFPSIPKNNPSSLACFYLSAVIVLITLTPQFAIRVLGITSKA